jgi:AraC-like DNA-binding protein
MLTSGQTHLNTFLIKLLCETATPIGEISIIVGFGECNYFSSKFKKVVGVTPYKYRLQVRDK